MENDCASRFAETVRLDREYDLVELFGYAGLPKIALRIAEASELLRRLKLHLEGKYRYPFKGLRGYVTTYENYVPEDFLCQRLVAQLSTLPECGL